MYTQMGDNSQCVDHGLMNCNFLTINTVSTLA